MIGKDSIKRFALKHRGLLNFYRITIGKIKTKYYFDAQKRELQKKGYNIISRIDEALSTAGAVFFVDCGTLLGMVRDNKLLEHDRDMDYGIYFTDHFTPADLDSEMKKLGMRKHKEFIFKGEVKEVTYGDGIVHIDFFSHKETENCSDIYVFYKNPDIAYPSTRHYSTLVMHRAHITGIKTMEISGVKMHVPENYEEYLESAYTKNWRIPDPNWKYMMEPGLEVIPNEFGICSK